MRKFRTDAACIVMAPAIVFGWGAVRLMRWCARISGLDDDVAAPSIETKGVMGLALKTASCGPH